MFCAQENREGQIFHFKLKQKEIWSLQVRFAATVVLMTQSYLSVYMWAQISNTAFKLYVNKLNEP